MSQCRLSDRGLRCAAWLVCILCLWAVPIPLIAQRTLERPLPQGSAKRPAANRPAAETPVPVSPATATEAEPRTASPVVVRRQDLDTLSVSRLAPRTIGDLHAIESAIQHVYADAVAATVAIRAGAAHGCGVIVTEGGHVLTAAHVAGWPGRQLMLQLSDGRRVSARTMGMNHAADSALVQIDDPGPWPHLEVGRSDELKLGQWCIALGYPGGYDSERKPALRVGRILAVNRNDTALLTDCTLTGGDSGGPLLNLEGEVIGVNSRIGADLAANLHVPVDEFRKHRDRYLASESWGQLGYFGVRDIANASSGDAVTVEAIENDSPAGRVGLRKGDQVTAIENRPVKTSVEFRQLERQSRPGSEVVLKVVRESEERVVRLRVAESPTPPHSDDDAELLESFLRRSGWRDRVIDAVGKNHYDIKQAARTAVDNTKLSAVRVLDSRNQIAMGTVVSRHGLVLTKASEVIGAKHLICRLFDSRNLPAEVVGHDVGSDLALLKVDADDLVPVKWASQDQPTVGTWLASVTTSRQPLMMGNVSATTSRVGRERPLLGIRMHRELDRPEVSDVIRGSAAESAGIQPGDQILAVDQQAVSDKHELIRLIGKHWPGEPLELKLLRGEEKMDLSVSLGSESDADADLSGFREFNGGQLSLRRSGFETAFRHDTPLQPNQCGGPIVNIDGECIGINIARAERVASYAVPASTVQHSLQEMMNKLDQQVTITAAKPVVELPAPTEAPQKKPTRTPESTRGQAPSSQAPSGQAPSGQAPSGQAPSSQSARVPSSAPSTAAGESK
ncbi:MAG: trypsin-like peptidase domain-containing protein [Pirellulales bacterium]